MKSRKRYWPFKVALLTLLVLAVGTALVWHGQVQRQRHFLLRHTHDVAFQASRRLQIFVESHLKMAKVFAKRWATHETQDFSKTRFEEFGNVLLETWPGYHALILQSPRNEYWTVSIDNGSSKHIEYLDQGIFAESQKDKQKVYLSDPVPLTGEETSFFAGLPLHRGHANLGCLFIEFRTNILVDDCFHEKIRSEFNFLIQHDKTNIYAFVPDGQNWFERQHAMTVWVPLQLQNQVWTLGVLPRMSLLHDSGWMANLAVPLLGVPLSLLLSFLVWLLLYRMELLQMATDRAMQEIEDRRRAQASLQVSEERHAQLSRKVLLAQEEERTRLSRELHDELGQTLTALRLEIGLLTRSLDTQSEAKNALTKNAVTLVENSTEELRRICRGLRPPLLDDLGLEPALQTLVRDFAEHSDIFGQFDMDGELHRTCVPPEVALVTYRIVQEALNNVSKHAKAKNVTASLFCTDSELQLSIQDDGVGFDPDTLNPARSCGIEGMRERARLVEGTLMVSSMPNRGTLIVFHVPFKIAKNTGGAM